MKNWIRSRWFWIGLAAVAIICLWLFLRPNKKTQAVQSTRTVHPGRGTITETINVSGVVSHGTQVEIYPQVNGTITELYVEKGDSIKKGQVIARLDTKDLLRAKRRAASDLEMARSQLAQAETNLSLQAKESSISEQQAKASLANAEATLSRLRAGTKPQEIAQAEASLRQVKLNLDNARQEEARQKLLYENGAISRQQYESAQKQVRMYQEDVYTQEQRLSLLKQGPDPAELRAAEAQVEQARAVLRGRSSEEQRRLRQEAVKTARVSLSQAQLAHEKAQEELAQAVVRSPIDGVVLDVPVKQGSLASSSAVSANTLLATVADLTMPKVEIFVNEADIAKLNVGQAAQIKIDALSQTWEGQVSRIDPKATESSNVVTFAVDVMFLNPPHNLKAGLTADVDLIVSQKENVLWLPSYAIRSQGDRSVVTVKEGDNIVRKTVRVGISDGSRTEIISGLTANDEVLIGSFSGGSTAESNSEGRTGQGNTRGNRGNTPFPAGPPAGGFRSR
jgi:HlyD family secretion protein